MHVSRFVDTRVHTPLYLVRCASEFSAELGSRDKELTSDSRQVYCTPLRPLCVCWHWGRRLSDVVNQFLNPARSVCEPIAEPH